MSSKLTLQQRKEAAELLCLAYDDPDVLENVVYDFIAFKYALQWIVNDPMAHPANMVSVARDALDRLAEDKK